MKNFEKYKTEEERVTAHKNWCDSHHDSCDSVCGCCGIKWLGLEAEEKTEEEEPMPCPFCGANCNMVSIESKSMYFLKCHCGCGYRSGYKSLPRAAISEHNRVCRAVKAGKESEVK